MRAALLASILFLSGISALIFETLWLRLSGLVFGNSVWATALILSSFMAGLALGNLIAGFRGLTLRPLFIYGWLETAVALSGCTIVFALPQLGQWFRPIFQLLWEHQTMLLALRFALSFLILLVPATAMGLTLPVLVSDPIVTRFSFRSAIGFLYGCNTLGAVVGALVTEAYTVERFGLAGTSVAAASLSVAAALLAFALSRSRHAADQETRRLSWESLRIALRRSSSTLLISFGAGLSLLTLEVAWLRFLRLYVASSTRAFAVVLAVILAAIGLGGLFSGLLARIVRWPERLIPHILLLASLATLICYWFFPTSAAHTAAGPFYLDEWRVLFLLASALTFATAFLSGTLLPLVVGNLEAAIPNRMNAAGWVILFNTIGASIGPILAAFILLPRFSFEITIVFCAVVYAVLAIVATPWEAWLPITFTRCSQLAVLTVVVIVFVFFPYGNEEKHLKHARELFVTDGSQLVKRVDGTADTLQLLRRDIYDEPYYYRLVTNNFSMSATTLTSQRYMRLFAYLPLFFNPNARDALLICYGCGVTADALVRSHQLQRVDMVDISKEVFSLAPDYQTKDYHNPLESPKAHPIVQDGRFFLQAAPARYDIITGEPPPLKVVGAVNLYTLEFFKLIRDALKDGGIASFWLPIDQLTPEEAKSILQAFHSAFPNASVWGDADTEWIMLGIRGDSPRLTKPELSRLWNDSTTRTDLVRIGLEVPEQAPALFLMDSNNIDELTEGALPLVDNYPKRLTDARQDEKAAYRFGWSYMEGKQALRRFLSSSMRQEWPEMSEKELEGYFLLRETRYLARAIGGNQMARLDLYLRGTKLRTPVLEALDTDEDRIAIAERASQRPEVSPPPTAVRDLVAAALARRDIAGAIRLLEGRLAGGRFAASDLFLLVYLYCVNGEVAKAEQLANSYATQIEKDWFVEWLWTKLHNDFGFNPPAT